MSLPYQVLKQRADFLAAAGSGFKLARPRLVVQARRRKADEIFHPPLASHAIRVGFTVTRTVGGAVMRNRAKRRLRAAAARLINEYGSAGTDYVFIGRKETITAAFDDLIDDMKHALKRLAELMRS